MQIMFYATCTQYWLENYCQSICLKNNYIHVQRFVELLESSLKSLWGPLRSLCVRWNCKIKRDLPVSRRLIVISSNQNSSRVYTPSHNHLVFRFFTIHVKLSTVAAQITVDNWNSLKVWPGRSQLHLSV